MKKKAEKPLLEREYFLIGLAVSIMLITCLFVACNTKSPVILSEEQRSSIVISNNVEIIDIINIEIETDADKKPSISSDLFLEAQKRHGNRIGIINIEKSPKNTEGDKVVWSCSAVVIRMKDNNYQALYDVTSKSTDRIYGAGSARLSTQEMSITTAATRARADIARTYNSTTEISEGQTVTTVRATIREGDIEQIVFTPDRTLWLMLSVTMENIAAE